MEAHHTNPVCASCHKIFEPIGLAIENFDAVGAWRTRDGDSPIDASGVLVDGTKIDGVADLREYSGASFRSVRARLYRENADVCPGPGSRISGHADVVRLIVRESAPDDCRFTSIVMGIVKSAPFQTNMKVSDGGEERAARRD